jgi:molecular chaperone GrpE
MAEEIDNKETAAVEDETVEAASEEVLTIQEEKPDKKKQSKTEKENKKLKKKVEKLEESLESAEEEIKELNDKYLRKQADFDNFRKRMLREKEDSIKFANKALLLDIVKVIDDFERALQSSEDSEDFKAFHSGIELIEKQMISMLETNWGLKRFDSRGEPFDPERHEALMVEESEDYDTQTVVEDFMKGYILHDRVIRHAKVKVSKPVTEKE